ncbi:MAG: hypothetical protein KF739_10335 [Cryobacterium sp.]|nr:hypothetical protein [Cryobacterium sp.]
MKAPPVWRRWPPAPRAGTRGPRFWRRVVRRPGWLLTPIRGPVPYRRHRPHPKLIGIARRNLAKAGLSADWRGRVENRFFVPGCHAFDIVANTMFSLAATPMACAAELARVLAGRAAGAHRQLPSDGNRRGTALVEHVWKPAGDLIRDTPVLLADAGLMVSTSRRSADGEGPIPYVATKPPREPGR